MQPVERTEVEGVDYGWVMQMTFVLTIAIGAPVVALLSTLVTLDTWGARAGFAIRVGAPIWFLTAVALAVYAKRTEAGDGATENEDGGLPETEDSDPTVTKGDGSTGTANDETSNRE